MTSRQISVLAVVVAVVAVVVVFLWWVGFFSYPGAELPPAD